MIAQVPDLGPKDTQDAIDAAARALPSWSAKTAKERAQLIKKWFDLITAQTEDLAQLMTSEQGKPLAEARGEVAYGASFILAKTEIDSVEIQLEEDLYVEALEWMLVA